MDSKLRALVITCAVLMIAVITGTVLLINVRNYERRKANEETAATMEDDRITIYNHPDKDKLDESFYAYQKDETFFDKELSEYEKRIRDGETKLNLLATSVEKDVRVRIMDDKGRLVTGQELYIILDGVEYKDLDRDGVVYVGDLSPGDYEVFLKEAEGFKVPTAPMNVNVKANVEFIPIEDISLLLKTEDDIDVDLEDSEYAVSGSEDVDESEPLEIKPTEGTRSFGIDVSKWNGEIDWARVRNAGVEFVIIRCGYRGSSTGALVEDPFFRRNLAGAKAAGLKVGLYFFTQAVNEVEAVEEASAVLSLNNGGSLDYPVFIDVEGSGGRADGLDTGVRTKVAKAFCDTIIGAGYMAGVYSSRSWLYNKLDAPQLEGYTIWLAEYRDSPLYQGKFNMWQYTDKGRIDGVNTNVDFNLSYGVVR